MRAINAAKKKSARRDGTRQRKPIASVAGLMLNDSSNMHHSTERALSPKARQAARASARRNAKNKGKKKAKRVIGHRLKTQAPPGGVSTISIGHGTETAKSAVLQKGAHGGSNYVDDTGSVYVQSGSPTALNPVARRKQLGGAQMAGIFGSMGGDNAEATFPKQQNVSSNAYASATHMNYGNSITDRSSTRVNAPPGGKSQITLGRSSKPSRRISRRERHEQQQKHQQRMRAAQEAKKTPQLPKQPKRQKPKQKIAPLPTGVLNGNSESERFVAYNPYNEKSQVVQIDDLPTEGLCLKTPRGRAPRDCVNATREELMSGMIPANASTTATRVGGQTEFGSGVRRIAPPGGRSSIKFI